MQGPLYIVTSTFNNNLKGILCALCGDDHQITIKFYAVKCLYNYFCIIYSIRYYYLYAWFSFKGNQICLNYMVHNIAYILQCIYIY